MDHVSKRCYPKSALLEKSFQSIDENWSSNSDYLIFLSLFCNLILHCSSPRNAIDKSKHCLYEVFAFKSFILPKWYSHLGEPLFPAPWNVHFLLLTPLLIAQNYVILIYRKLRKSLAMMTWKLRLAELFVVSQYTSICATWLQLLLKRRCSDVGSYFRCICFRKSNLLHFSIYHAMS